MEKQECWHITAERWQLIAPGSSKPQQEKHNPTSGCASLDVIVARLFPQLATPNETIGPLFLPARTAMANEGGRRAQHRCKIMALQLAMLAYSHGAAASLGRHRTLAFATAPRLLPSRLRRPAASACRQEAAAASSARMGADRDEDVFQYLMHGGVRGTSTLQRGNAGAAATALQCAAPTRADGDITGTILRLDTELTGAWSEEGTAGAGQRSKAWFKQQEEERVRKVQSVRLRHILVATSDLALQLQDQLRNTRTDFEELAAQISNCEASRKDNGNIGWVSLADDFLDETLPLTARQSALARKPGDIFLAETARGWHVIKVEDVMYDLKREVRARAKPYGRDGAAYFAPLKDLMGQAQDSVLKYSVETMGCQMNSADSERIAGQLDSMGLVRTEEPLQANVVVYNTCSIRDHAEQKVYSYIGPQAERKRRGDTVAIVVAGCVAQQEGDKLLRRIPEIDLVMGPQYANRVSDLLEDVINGNQVVATEAVPISEDMTRPRRDSDLSAWVNIIYGCNERCTYCVVPTTRGVEQSRPRDSIRKEMMALAAQGYREVTLLGQNIDAWGRDMEPKQKFADLLEYLAALERLHITCVGSVCVSVQYLCVCVCMRGPMCVRVWYVCLRVCAIIDMAFIDMAGMCRTWRASSAFAT